MSMKAVSSTDLANESLTEEIPFHRLSNVCPTPNFYTFPRSTGCNKRLATISGDSLVLRGRPGLQGQPPKERFAMHLVAVYSFADIVKNTASSRHHCPEDGELRERGRGAAWYPHVYTYVLTLFSVNQRWAFESREFLRALTVGKEISFVSTHALPTNEDTPRDIGNAEIGGLDIASELLKNGWAKMKELKRELTEDDLKKRESENEAKAARRGLWSLDEQQVPSPLLDYSFHRSVTTQARTVHYSMPADSQGYVFSSSNGIHIRGFASLDSSLNGRGSPLMVRPLVASHPVIINLLRIAIVEQVKDGTTFRVRLLMPTGEHQMANIALAGIRSPRVSSKQGESSESWAEEVSLLHISHKSLNFRACRQNSLPSRDSSSVLFESKYSLCLLL
jgi:staphylococcal nuclease domain-containing protein 1